MRPLPSVSARPRSVLVAGAVTLGGIAALALLHGGGRAEADGTCSIFWTGATSTAWNTASNWSATDGGASIGRVPAATDVVCMSSAPTRTTVVYPNQNRTLIGLNFTNPSTSLEIQGGTLTVNTNAGTIANLVFDAGTLAGSAPMSLTGSLSFPGSGVTFTGATKTIASGATLSSTAFITVGGTAAGQNGTLVNAGTMSLTGTTMYLATGPSTGTGSVFTNTGSFALVDGANLDTTGSGPKLPGFTTSGTLTVSGSADSNVTVGFTNTGTVTTTTAALLLSSGNAPGSSDTGTWATSATKGVSTYAGNRSVTGGAFTGTAGLTVSGGTTTFSGGVTITNLLLNGGTVSGSVGVGTGTLVSGLVSGPGTMTLSGTGSTLCSPAIDSGATVLNAGTATIDSACGAPYLQAGGHLTNTGTLTVSGGTATNGYNAVNDDGNSANGFLNDTGGTLTVTGTGNPTYYLTPPSTNRGTVNVAVGTLLLTSGNVAGTTDTGTTTVAAGTALGLAGGARTIAAGTVTGAGELLLNGATVTFTGNPSISTLHLVGGSASGNVSVTTGKLDGGLVTGPGTMTLTGTGSTLCSPAIDGSATVLNAGTATITSACGAPYLQAGGHLTNTGSLTVSGGTSTNGYNAVNDDGNSANSVLNDTGGTLTVTGTGNPTYYVTPKLTNNGTITVNKGNLLLLAVTNLSGAGVLTGGTWNAAGGTIQLPRTVTTNAADVTIGATGAITAATTGGPAFATLATNTGSFRTSTTLTTSTALTTSGALTVLAGTTRANSITQTGGVTTVAAGAILRSGSAGTAAVAVSGGQLTGSGTVQGALALSGSGVLTPGTGGSGTLAVTGTYAATGGATLAVTAGATSTAVSATGAASLGGTLAITTALPAPALGTSTTVVTGSSRTGTFGTVTGQDVPSAGGYWAVGYTGTTAFLTLTPYPTVSVNSVAVAEGNTGTSTATFTATLSAPSPVAATVQYATADGMAVAPTDYTATSGTVTFAPGATSATFTVTVIGDSLYENDETFAVQLSSPTGATLGTASGTGTITNDDAPPALSVADAGGATSTAGGGTVVFPVTLSTPSGLTTTVQYATADGTAVAGADYTATTGTLTIAAGQTSGTVTVQLTTKTTPAPPKTFTLVLSNPVNATIDRGTATGTISNTNPNGPTLTAVTPASGALNTTVAVTLTGTGFAGSPTVTVSGLRVTVSGVTVVNATTVTASFAVGAAAPLGARDVTITQGATSSTCTGCFTVVARPAVTSTDRPVVATGSVDVVANLTGTAFVAGMDITFTRTGGGTIAATSTTVTSATGATTVFTVGKNVTPGPWNIVATNADGGTTTCTNCLTVVAAPTITAVSPSAFTRGTTVNVTVTGTGFLAGTVVSLPGGLLSNVTVVNSTTITFTATIKPTAATGSKLLKVIEPVSAGGGTATFAVTIS